MTTLKTIASFALVPEAELFQSKLNDAGINAFIFKDDCGGMHPHMQFTGGVQLKVAVTDFETAEEILSTTADHLETSEQETLLNTVRHLIYRSKGWILLGFTIIFGFVSLPISFYYATKAMRVYKMSQINDVGLKNKIIRLQVASAVLSILFWGALVYYLVIYASTELGK